MKIECKIKRNGGSQVDLDGVKYHFKPELNEKDSPHVCEIDSAKHIRRLLSIEPETYIAHVDNEDDIDEITGNMVDDSQTDGTPDGETSEDSDSGDGEGDDVDPHEDENADHNLANLSASAYADDEEDGDADDDSAQDVDAGQQAPVETEEQRLERLTAEHIEVFGKKPHHKASADKIQQKLNDHAAQSKNPA